MIKFLKAMINSLKRINLRYAQVTLKTMVSQNTPDDEKKNYILGISFFITKPHNYYSLLLINELIRYKESNRYKPFLLMDTGLHELSYKYFYAKF